MILLVCGLLVLPPDVQADEEPQVIHIFIGFSWNLIIEADGSGAVQYGPHPFPFRWGQFPPGTFLFDQLLVDFQSSATATQQNDQAVVIALFMPRTGNSTRLEFKDNRTAIQMAERAVDKIDNTKGAKDRILSLPEDHPFSKSE